jgi:hypothetical protein
MYLLMREDHWCICQIYLVVLDQQSEGKFTISVQKRKSCQVRYGSMASTHSLTGPSAQTLESFVSVWFKRSFYLDYSPNKGLPSAFALAKRLNGLATRWLIYA